MINAKEELLAKLERAKSIIKCATIRTERNSYWDDNDNYVQPSPILLKEGYTPAEYEAFLDRLDFEYDSGYGGQELYGTVWLMKEHTWLSRGEYDGSEWWEYNECPKVPDELKREDNHYMSTL
jgi:hypothetical protein